MSKMEWGHHFWYVIHTAAAQAVKYNQRSQFVSLIENINALLPCKTCREHFKEFRKKTSIYNYTSSNESLLYWTYLAHNSATIVSGKKQRKISFEEVKKKYLSKSGTSTCPVSVRKTLTNFRKNYV